MNKNFKKLIVASLSSLMILNLVSIRIYAQDSRVDVEGKVYTFEDDNKYTFSKSKKFGSSEKKSTYGNFTIAGDLINVSQKDGVPTYEVSSDNIELFYTYDDSLLKAEDKSWHLVSEKSKKIDEKKLDDKIENGVLILQTSKDRINWVDIKSVTNVFKKEPVKTDSFYTSEDVQLLNGCYYRLIVAYRTQREVKPKKVLFMDVVDRETKKHAEVYEFYAYSKNSNQNNISEQQHNLGKRVRTKNFDGYYGKTSIKKGKDPHYGWKLGQFYVDGYTDKVKNKDGNMVFLKNVGDKISLWFNLKQDINKLNGNENLSITADTGGYDQYFETPMMDFGRGTLIVRYTDYNGNQSEPQIYTNFLEANTIVGTDTKVQLFEEGDYEVALDYEVTDNKLLDKVGHYRIFFKFSVRNGNCMVYPFDLVNGNELTNTSMTENGFKLDLAKSRYLKVNVKKETLKDGTDGLVEDVRFNGPAKDGQEYTDEGIYTMTVKNNYTNQTTTKKIYIGNNNIMKAYMNTELSISKINELVKNGAKIDDKGVITLPTKKKNKKNI